MTEEEGASRQQARFVMNEKLAERPALIDAAIANRMKRFREQLGLSQSRLGLKIALNGLPWWKSATVGITEAGRRKTHIYELAAIAKVFDLTVEEFLAPDPEHDDEDTVAALRRLGDRLWPKPEGDVFVDLDDDERPMSEGAFDAMMDDLRAVRMRNALEEVLCRKVGLRIATINELALLLWGHDAANEMDARLGAPVTAATPQARGHITRQLIKELKAFDTSLSDEGGA